MFCSEAATATLELNVAKLVPMHLAPFYIIYERYLWCFRCMSNTPLQVNLVSTDTSQAPTHHGSCLLMLVGKIYRFRMEHCTYLRPCVEGWAAFHPTKLSRSLDLHNFNTSIHHVRKFLQHGTQTRCGWGHKKVKLIKHNGCLRVLSQLIFLHRNCKIRPAEENSAKEALN